MPLIAAEKPVEGTIDAFQGEAKFELQQLFTGARFPNVVVATDGTVLATWGFSGGKEGSGRGRWSKDGLRVRRSEDGGKTWGDPITIAKPGWHGGGVTVDETSGDILAFAEQWEWPKPPLSMTVWASFDGAKTWPIKRQVIDGPTTWGSYSSLSARRPGTPSEGWAYILLEGGKTHRYEGAYLARFTLSWLLKGEKTGDGDVPVWIRRS